MAVYTDRGTYIASGAAVEGALTTIVDLRGTNGTFFRCNSGSGNGPTAGASAIFNVEHSHDMTAWTVIETVTASKGTVATAFHSAGAYSYLRANIVKVYSAAQTGTGSVWIFVRPGVP